MPGFGAPQPGSPYPMAIGTSLVLIAVGAVLKFAVTEEVSGIKIETVGTILMVVGIVGGLISLVMMSLGSRRAEVVERRYDAPDSPTRPL